MTSPAKPGAGVAARYCSAPGRHGGRHGWRLWRALAKRYGVPRPLVDATQIALRYLAYLAIGAAAVFAVVFLVNISRQGEMMNDYPTISGLGIAGLVLLSVLYIPNAIVSTAAVLVGSEFSVGEGSVSLFSAHLVPLPPLPITGGIPASAPSWAVALLIVPSAPQSTRCTRSVRAFRTY